MLVAIYSADNNTRDDVSVSLPDTLSWQGFSSCCFDVQVHLPAPKQRIHLFIKNKDIEPEKLALTEEDMSVRVDRYVVCLMVLNPSRRAAARHPAPRRAAIRAWGREVDHLQLPVQSRVVRSKW